jgi:hypothetical protein
MEEEAAVTDLAAEVEDTLLSVAVVTDSVLVTHLADSPAVALARDSAGRGGFPLVDFLVAEITAALVTVVSVDVIATFAIVGFAISIGTFSISASLASDIQVITPITIDTPITIHTRIRTTKAILSVDQSGDYRTQHLL